MIIKTSQLHNFLQATKTHQTIVLVTGVFDLLHSAHIQFLRLAKNQGDILLVGLETDKRVRQLKGEGRPTQNLECRMRNIDQLDFVDYAFALPEKFDTQQDFENLIALIKPDILAVSAHTPNLAVKKNLIEKFEGQLKIVMQEDKTISTTQILQRQK